MFRISIEFCLNLLAFYSYLECCSLIGYATHKLITLLYIVGSLAVLGWYQNSGWFFALWKCLKRIYIQF